MFLLLLVIEAERLREMGCGKSKTGRTAKEHWILIWRVA